LEAILFDLDDTLIVDDAVSAEAYLAAAQLAVPVGADPYDLAQAAKENAVRLWQEGPHYAYCKRIGHSATEGLWARYDTGAHPTIGALRQWVPRYQEQVWREALEARSIWEPGLPARLAARFAEARRRYPHYPEVPGLLNALLEKGYKLGIITNGVPDLQREKLAGFELAHRFDFSVVSGEIDCGKPDPGIFHYAAMQMGVDVKDCVMVGDNPARDVAGAMACGMKSVFVSRNGRERDEQFPGDLACTDLSAILPWLEAQ
jgi:HAD superfamily hydrolase (TIGR01549 family)